MRQIKFRAWNKEKKQMFYVEEEEFGNDTTMKLTLGNEKQFRMMQNGYMFCHGGDSILMQFTGLKDKKGKEIYEGDIIDGRYGKSEVRWSDNHCGFIPFAYPNNAPTEEECEVIGNIYENPELLNEVKNGRKEKCL